MCVYVYVCVHIHMNIFVRMYMHIYRMYMHIDSQIDMHKPIKSMCSCLVSARVRRFGRNIDIN